MEKRDKIPLRFMRTNTKVRKSNENTSQSGITTSSNCREWMLRDEACVTPLKYNRPKNSNRVGTGATPANEISWNFENPTEFEFVPS